MLVNGIGLKTPEFCGFSRLGERLGTTLNKIMVPRRGIATRFQAIPAKAITRQISSKYLMLMCL